MTRSFLCAALLLPLLAACASHPQSHALRVLKEQLAAQYHECVPLGWAPVPVGDSYYPGYTAALQSYHEWLDGIWVGKVYKRDLSNPQARTVTQVLDAFVQAGLMTSAATPDGRRYNLTPAAVRYYFGSEIYDNNHGSMPYLCYSSIEPVRIVWQGPPAREHNRRRSWLEFHAAFEWKASAPAYWATPFLRSHAVILPPTTSPSVGDFQVFRGNWYLVNIYSRGLMLPSLANKDAWLTTASS